MKGFKQFITEEKLLVEGGNAKAINRKTQEVIARPQRMDMSKVSRKEIRKKLLDLFKDLNIQFGKKYEEPLWPSITVLTSGHAFNGSTEHLFDPEISDAEFKKYKKVVGDVDLTVPKKQMSKLFDLLADLEKKKLGGGHFVYLGQNKPKLVGHAINAIFQLQEPKVSLQVDFEGVNYEGDSPDAFGKFSHNSTWKDVQQGVKGLAHKILIQNFARVVSQMNNIVILTPSSVDAQGVIKAKPKVSSSITQELPTNLAFSVDRGVREKYAPAKDSKGSDVYIDGKQAFYQVKTINSKYSTDLSGIYQMLFNRKPKGDDLQKFHSFNGMLSLMKSNRVSQKVISNIFISILEKSFFGKYAAGTENNNPEGDRNTKMVIVNRIVKEFPYLKSILEKSQQMIDRYYDNYKEVKVDS